MNIDFSKLPSGDDLNTTVDALKSNGFTVEIVNTKEEAKPAVLKLIPKGSEVFTGTSVTLDQTGLNEVLNGSDFDSARNKMMALRSQPEKKKEMKQISGTADYALGSVHAITQDGRLLIASATGSQLSGEVYGADKVIFVVGTQKLVKDLMTGVRRIEEHSVPLEDKRAQAAYGINTSFSKLLVINKDVPGRITIILIKEKIGF